MAVPQAGRHSHQNPRERADYMLRFDPWEEGLAERIRDECGFPLEFAHKLVAQKQEWARSQGAGPHDPAWIFPVLALPASQRAEALANLVEVITGVDWEKLLSRFCDVVAIDAPMHAALMLYRAQVRAAERLARYREIQRQEQVVPIRTRISAPRVGRRRRSPHGAAAARPISGGSDDGDGSGDGGDGPSVLPVPQPAPPSEPTPPLEPSGPHTRERTCLLAQSCACCGAPLCDAISVSVGLGPYCRRNLGLSGKLGKQLLANATVALVVEACERADAKEALRLVGELRNLDPGYQKLADRIEKRWLGSVKFLVLESTSNQGTHFTIKTPYSPEFVQFCRDSGFRWQKPIKQWRFPTDKLPDVLNAIGLHYDYPNVLTTDLKRYEPGSQDYRV